MEQKEKYGGHARASGGARKERANEPPNREKNKTGLLLLPPQSPGGFIALALHLALSLLAHPSQTDRGSKT